MEIHKVKDLNLYLKRHKYCFLYIHDSWCSNTTLELDTFFKSKYDLNKIFLKICVSNAQKIIKTLDITMYPIILVYNKDTVISEIYCTQNLINNLEKVYNFLD